MSVLETESTWSSKTECNSYSMSNAKLSDLIVVKIIDKIRLYIVCMCM